jgi:hypothetical protein
MTSTITRSMAGAFGIAAVAGTVACGARDGGPATMQAGGTIAAPQSAASPVMVTCEPNQRTLVRPVVVNGAALSQVECVSIDTPVTAPATFSAPAAAPPAAAQPIVYQSLPDARVIQAEQPARVVRSVPARQVVYRPADDEVVRARPKRSVAKSAVIIGSAAGGGAGLGALIGGKKGALIGAAIGGGGATVWDQVTRRK